MKKIVITKWDGFEKDLVLGKKYDVLGDYGDVVNFRDEVGDLRTALGGRDEYTVTEGEDLSSLNAQEGGSHYKDMAIQPAEYNTKNNIGFLEGNVIKYVSRHKKKNGAEDLKKAKHCIDLLLEMTYGDAK